MRGIWGFIASIFAALVVAGDVTQMAFAQTAYLPLAHLRLLVAADKADDVEDLLDDFCENEQCKVKGGSYPKGFRWVENSVVRFGPETFFHVGNFRDNQQFELVAYSHEDTTIWQPKWDAFIAKLKEKFGEKSIQPY